MSHQNLLLAAMIMAAVLVTPSRLEAQRGRRPTTASALIQAARGQIDSLNTDSAAVLLRRVFLPAARASRDQQVLARVLLGFTDLAVDLRTEARQEFRRALELDPGTSVDSLRSLHPQLVTIFEEVRREIASELTVRARDSLNAGIGAYGRADFDVAVRLLPFGLVNNLASRRDPVWLVGIRDLADALLARRNDSLAGVWLRWAVREFPDVEIDTANASSQLRDAFARARSAVGRPRRADALATTGYEWDRSAQAGQGAIRLMTGPDPVTADIDGVRLATGTSRRLPARTYTIRFSIHDSLFSIDREVLPRVTTVLQFRYAAPATRLAFRAQPQRLRAGDSLGTVLVAVVDNAGNPVASATTRVTVALGTNTTGATLSGRREANAVAGVATFGDLRIDRPGSYTLTASASGLSSVTSSTFEVTPKATRLAFLGEVGAATVGGVLPAVRVAVQDADGNTVPGATNTVRIALGSAAAGATLGGPQEKSALNGVATFDSVRIDRPGRHSLVASAQGLGSATSNTFGITAVPARLAFRGALPSAPANALLPAIEVALQDSAGSVVTTAANPVTIAIATNTAGAALLGRAAVTAINGVARFDSLRITQPGRFTITASAQGVATGASGTIEITAAAGQQARGAPTPTRPPVATPTPAPATPQPATPAAPSAPVNVAIAAQPELLSGGATHSCGVTARGIACWGDNSDGQLGDGTRAAKSTPVDVSPGRYVSVSSGDQHTCALKASDSLVVCWGRNNDGQLGNGQNASAFTPVQIAGARRYLALSVGANHTCALAVDSLAYCWGANDQGQLGTGSKNPQNTPTAVQGSRRYASLSAGANHTCAITSTGGLYCWGQNDDGQLGDGTTNQRSVLGAVSGVTTIAVVSAGTNHTCAIGTSGTLTCWGGNDDGQLGDSSTSRRTRPVGVRGGRSYVAVSAGDRYTCAVSSANDAFCWGRNDEGQLGLRLPSGNRSPVPRAVSGTLKFVLVTAGRQHTCGALLDGRSYCWGNNSQGRLGNGSTTSSVAPVPVTGVTVPRPSGS